MNVVYSPISPFRPIGINIDSVYENRMMPARRKLEQPVDIPRWEDGTPKSLNNVFNWRNVK